MRKLAEHERGQEYLDDPTLAPGIAAHSLNDIALANRLFGGTRAVLAEVRDVLDTTLAQQPVVRLLDVGTGQGDIPKALGRLAATRAQQMQCIGLEITPAMASIAAQQNISAVTGDARALPFADASFDIVTCSLVLHHLGDADAIAMLRECSRVASVRVVVADLRRSWLALVLLWLVSFPLRFHAISRHDGMLSIRRGYTIRELSSLVERACSVLPRCRRRLGWRLSASWAPNARVMT
ncbi:MAG: methyltransferase domain-containing protein [Gemmatimonas sp.]